jgi:hypothetical protein
MTITHLSIGQPSLTRPSPTQAFPIRAARKTPTGAALDPDPQRLAVRRPALDVVVPVYNEESALERSVLALYARLRADLPYSFRITIADNASADDTWSVAQRLASAIPFVTSVRLLRNGRGGALREVWAASDADVLAYLDVDLSTDLAVVLPLIAPLVSGHSDLAVGTRLSPTARCVRGARFADGQCGFTAIRADPARELLPLVQDNAWFFDTELLLLAERAGLRIHEGRATAT